MHGRQVSKLFKLLIVLLIYSLVYIVISFLLSPSPIYKFVDEDIRVGDKYVLIYLVAKGPMFSDMAGADVFRIRRCGSCFITNNKGFLPLTEYDAIVVHGNRRLIEETSAFMDPEKRYVMETPRTCLHKKLVGCDVEPRVTSLESRKEFDLCGLCRHLHEKRDMTFGVKRRSADTEDRDVRSN